MSSQVPSTIGRAWHPGPPSGRVQTRLPWWGMALPVLAFAALLMLLSGPGRGGSSGAEHGAAVLDWISQALPGLAHHVL